MWHRDDVTRQRQCRRHRRFVRSQFDNHGAAMRSAQPVGIQMSFISISLIRWSKAGITDMDAAGKGGAGGPAAEVFDIALCSWISCLCICALLWVLLAQRSIITIGKMSISRFILYQAVADRDSKQRFCEPLGARGSSWSPEDPVPYRAT